MKKPSLLSEKDKYNLQPSDFESRFERYIFIAILNSYNNGAQSLSEIDIDNYLMDGYSITNMFALLNGIYISPYDFGGNDVLKNYAIKFILTIENAS